MQIHPPAQCKLSTAFLWSQRWAPANAICGGSWGHAMCNEIEEENNVRIYTCYGTTMKKNISPMLLGVTQDKTKIWLIPIVYCTQNGGSIWILLLHVNKESVKSQIWGTHKKYYIILVITLHWLWRKPWWSSFVLHLALFPSTHCQLHCSAQCEYSPM